MFSSGAITISNQRYEEDIDYVVWPYGESAKNLKQLEKLKLLPKLSGASFSGCDLNDAGLMLLSGISQLQNLDLQSTCLLYTSRCV